MAKSCLTDTELMMVIDGELPALDQRTAEAHLRSCWRCRARRSEVERTIEDFVHWYGAVPMPPPEGPRAMLRAQMDQIAAHPPTLANRWLKVGYVGAVALASCLVGILIWGSSGRLAAATPNRRNTPGMTLPVTLNDVCQHDFASKDQPIPETLARQVFKRYSINDPGSGHYEVDYLITPALGGAEDIRNMWPQPYSSGVWNAHVKDALEDLLHQKVCTGQIKLAQAQRDLAENWVAAYQRYFHTALPLTQHVAFVKDKPWN